MAEDPINSYVAFWNKYFKICSKHRLSVAPSSIPFVSRPNCGNFEIFLKEPIHLQNWRENSASSNTIDILVNGTEVVDPKKAIILTSNVSVNYFDTSQKQKKILTPLQSIHFDYAKAEVGHPYFHAQLSEGLIKERTASESFKRFDLDPDHLDDRLKGIRIPTAHMSLISVLIGLIADHTGRTKEQKIVLLKGGKKIANVIPARANALEEILEAIRKIPKVPNASCTKPSMIADKAFSFRSILWYPEFR